MAKSSALMDIPDLSVGTNGVKDRNVAAVAGIEFGNTERSACRRKSLETPEGRPLWLRFGTGGESGEGEGCAGALAAGPAAGRGGWETTPPAEVS